MYRYRWQLPVRLAACIENHGGVQAHRNLDQVLRTIAKDPSRNLTLRKLRSAQVASFCLRGALRGGASSNVLLEERLRMLQQLAVQKSWKKLERLMHAYVDQLLAKVRTQRRTNLERYIAWMRQDMRSSIDSPKSLAQYAEAAALSTGHLSRCFAAISGSPFRDELRRLRIETACRLLRDKSLKVSTVTRMVGLRDTSQFIEDFRRETGQTPGAFRELQRA